MLVWYIDLFFFFFLKYLKYKKFRNENVINDLREEIERGNNATNKRTVSNVLNGVCTCPSNFI